MEDIGESKMVDIDNTVNDPLKSLLDLKIFFIFIYRVIHYIQYCNRENVFSLFACFFCKIKHRFFPLSCFYLYAAQQRDYSSFGTGSAVVISF